MKLFGYDFSFKQVNDIVNVDRALPASRNVLKTIVKKQLSRQKEDIKKWRDALGAAENITRPSRLALVRIYTEVMLDAHISSVTETRKLNVSGFPFRIVDAEGEDLTEVKKRTFEQKWFFDTLALCIDAVFHGYTLMQLGDIIEDRFAWVKNVPREHIKPETSQFLVNISDSEGVDFTRPPWSNWTLWVDTGNFGLLNNAAPLAIWKKTLFGAWSEFNEVYGNPLIIGRTDINDPEQRKNMENMLDSLIDASWGVFGEQDQLEVVSGLKVGGHNTFRDEIKLINEEVSKLILGQTMTSEDGASRSQAEVHADVMNAYLQRDLRFIQYIINDQLLPLMKRAGMIPENAAFKWSTEAKLSLENKQNFVIQLLNNYDIAPEWINQEFNIPVEEMASAPQTGGDMSGVENKITTVMHDVDKLYNEVLLKHKH